jgi:O-antigen/teichoic acid export membrane protein
MALILTPGLGLRGLALNIGATFVRQIVAALLQLGIVALIARVYGPEGNGAFAVALLVPSLLASFLNLGVAPANVYHLGGKHYQPRAILRSNFKIFAFLGLLGLVTGGAMLYLRGHEWFPGVDPRVLWFALAIFPVSLLNSYLHSIFQGLQQFRPYNLLAIAQPGLLLVFVALLTVLGNQNLALLIAAQFLAVFLVLLLTLLWLRPVLLADQSPHTASIPIKQTLSYGWKAHLSNMLAFVNYKADVFLANLFLGPAAVGVYVIAVALAEKLWLMSQAVSTVLLPRLAELNVDEAKRKQLTPLVTRWVLLATLLAALALAAAAHWLIALIFGADYAGALLPFWILLPGMVFLAGSRVIANDIAARGRPDLNLYGSILVVTINVVGNLILIPRHGLSGAAAATTFAYGADLILRLWIYGWFTKNRWVDSLFVKGSDVVMIRAVLRAN